MAGFQQKGTKGKVKAVFQDALFMRGPTVMGFCGMESAFASWNECRFKPESKG